MSRTSAAFLVACAAATPTAQTPAPGPAFDVASVKPNRSGDPGTQFGLPGGGNFTATNATARELVRVAFQLQEYHLVGLPEWTRQERFDVIARTATDITLTGDPSRPSPVFLLMQALLRERFQLAAHTETRDMPIYALVLTQADGRLGPKFTRSTTDCAAVLKGLRAQGRNGAVSPSPSDPVQCGTRFRPGLIAGGAVELDGGEFSLAMLLSRLMRRTVVNRTGLTGVFDFTLEFAPDAPASPSLPPADPGFVDVPRPALTTALQEQLGLKLESARGPIDVFVVDRFERPEPD